MKRTAAWALAGHLRRVLTKLRGAAACGVFVLALCGCTTRGSFWPTRQQFASAALGAARHPATWVPLAGAATIAAGGWDHDLSDWARERTPVFGSAEAAEERSGQFRSLAYCGMVVSAVIPRDQEEEYWIPTAGRLAWNHAGLEAAAAIRVPIKKLTDRDRPSGDSESLPSGHSTKAFAAVGMTYRNIEGLRLHPAAEYSAKAVETGFGYATAWARVEAGAHYPTDVLAGAALGNYVSLFIHDAFLGRACDVHVAITPEGVPALSFRHTF